MEVAWFGGLEGRELSEARVPDSRVGLGLFAIKVTKDIIDVSLTPSLCSIPVLGCYLLTMQKSHIAGIAS